MNCDFCIGSLFACETILTDPSESDAATVFLRFAGDLDFRGEGLLVGEQVFLFGEVNFSGDIFPFMS